MTYRALPIEIPETIFEESSPECIDCIQKNIYHKIIMNSKIAHLTYPVKYSYFCCCGNQFYKFRYYPDKEWIPNDNQ